MSSKWCFTTDNRTILGPFSLEEVQGLIRSGQLKPHFMAMRIGSNKWGPVESFGALGAMFPRQAVTAKPPIKKSPPKEQEAPPERKPTRAPRKLTKPAASSGLVILLLIVL